MALEFWVIECTARTKFNWLARAIMKIQGVDFSHLAFVVYNVDEDAATVFDARWPKAQKTTLENFLKKYRMVRTYKLRPPVWNEPNHVEIHAHHLVKDTEYSLAQLFLIWAQLAFKKYAYPIGRIILNHDKAMVCSEFIARIIFYGWGAKYHEQWDSIDLVEATMKAREYMEPETLWPK